MKKISIYMLAVTLIGCSIFNGCTNRLADLTIVSTKNAEIGAKYKKVRRAEGVDKTPYVLFIPIGRPDMEEAIDECIKNGKGVLLTDAVVKYTNWWAILYGEQDYTIVGDVWVKADLGDLNNPEIELFELRGNASSGLELVSDSNPENILRVTHYSEE